MDLQQFNHCCGVYELGDLSHIPEENLENLYKEAYDWGNENPTFIVFADAAKGITMEMDGRKLEQYIKKHKLGDILRTKPKKNTKSGNMLYVWVWTIDKKAFTKWKIKNYGE